MVKVYVKKKAVVMKLLRSNNQRVSLTTDIWVAPITGASYMVITAHFIDASWQLRNLIIGFKHVSDHIGNDALLLGGDFLHLCCCAHIINLVVKDGQQDVDNRVSAIRNAVQYVRASSKRVEAFEKKVDSGKMTSGSLSLDCQTRWNSTYLMLTRAIKFRVAFERMEMEDKLYNDHFTERDEGKARIGPPTVYD